MVSVLVILMVKALILEGLFAAVHMHANCDNENEGCGATTGETVYPACVTYDKDTSLVVAGFCPAALWEEKDPLYYNHDSVCFSIYRTGTLCGSCMANMSVMKTNSEKLKCVPDSECHFWSWLLYIASYLSTTLMLIIIVIFQPQLVSPKFNAAILAAQLIALPSNLHTLQVKSIAGIGAPEFFNRLIYDLYHIWNLDSTAGTLPHFRYCLPSTQHALAMDYLPAIYILTLALVLYAAIKLHANNCVIVVRLWKPFARCFSRLRRQVNPQASVIYAFAIFLLLAYSSIVQTSMYLLLPTGVYNINGTLLRLVMLFDGMHC